MPFTKQEQNDFAKLVQKRCKPKGKAKRYIKQVADFLFDLTGDVNLRMAIFNRYEN